MVFTWGHCISIRLKNISRKGPRNCRSLGFARDDKGEGDASIRIRCWWREPQVPPLRYAPVGMTIHIGARDASAQENFVNSIEKSQALGMTKERAMLPWRAIARQKVFFITLGGRASPCPPGMTKGRAMLPCASGGWWREPQVPVRLRSGQVPHSLRFGPNEQPPFIPSLTCHKSAARDDNFSWALADSTKI